MKSGGHPSSHCIEAACVSIERRTAQTNELLGVILDRMDCLQADVKRIDNRTALATEPNLPVDPNYVNDVLANNHEKIRQLLPMRSDEMVFEFEQCLVASALEANDRGLRTGCVFTRFLN
jgi:hypothetical protein